MTVTINVPCRYCQQTEPVRKHGFGKTGEPRYFCRTCLRSFQINYRYNAHKLNRPGFPGEKVIRQFQAARYFLLCEA